jgi:alginate O-acetyltransferase complex protein AlgI
MLFPTFEFGLFFLAVYAANWAMRDRGGPRKLFLLAASYYFYGSWDWRFTVLLAASSAINYLAGRALAATGDPRTRRLIVGGAVAANLTILGFFKYYGFFIDSLTDLLLALGIQRDLPVLEIILPVGISFFTFQGISYVVDVHRGHVKPVTTPIDLFLYISFFPQLVAGPIVRASHFLPQLERRPSLDPLTLAYGLVLIVSGLFKKIVLAHYLAVDLVDPVYFDPASHTTVDLVGAHYAYAIQVYLDFSAYSDIAIGVAALLGYRFRKNFDRPFGATSMAQLWQRWHISLSTFLRDYLYRALRGDRRESTVKSYWNMFLTMLLGGLWHGAAWTFVIWGAIHGVALVVERHVKRMTIWPDLFPWAWAFLGWLITFHVFSLASIFFRSPGLETATSYFAAMAALTPGIVLFTPFMLLLVTGSLAAQFLPGDALERLAGRLCAVPTWALGLLLGGAILVIESIGPEGVAPFIYYQF